MGESVRVAVVQAGSVVMDGPASVDKACDLIAEAGAQGARLIRCRRASSRSCPARAGATTTA